MKKMMDYILSNLVFITRIPVRIRFEYRSDSGNVKYFPLVGIILGMVLFFVGVLIKDFFLPLTNAFLIYMLLVFLTGGIHLDGLSDTADGLLSYRSSEKIIEIMKDSRIGAMGVLSLILISLMKIFFLNELLAIGSYFYLLLLPVQGRLCIVNACYFGKPINQSKLGKGFIGNMGRLEFFSVHAVYFFIEAGSVFLPAENVIDALHYSLALLGTQIILICATWFFIRHVTTKIEGISGDILGAACELGEAFSMPIFIAGVLLCEKFI